VKVAGLVRLTNLFGPVCFTKSPDTNYERRYTNDEIRYTNKGERRDSLRGSPSACRTMLCRFASGGFSSLMGILGLWVFRNILCVMRKQKRVKDGIRTRDPRNHNPMLYPTELLSPLRFPILHSLSIICKFPCFLLYSCFGEVI
jgi:hypothetical protein